MVSNNNKPQQNFLRVNHYIRANEVRVIAEDGKNLGVQSLTNALKMARDAGTDLIEINGKSNPPVVKLMDLGKWKYEEKKRQSEMKKNAATNDLKEIGLHLQTELHDLQTKTKQAREFLDEGHRVKWNLRLRGREQQHSDLAVKQLQTVLEMLGDVQVIEAPKQEGKVISMTIGKVSGK